MWPVSHFCNMLHPSRFLDETSQITRECPTLTTGEQGLCIHSSQQEEIYLAQKFVCKELTQQVFMYQKILTNTSSIPASHFIPHPSPSPRLHHNKPLFIPLVKTTSYKSSFFVDVISLQNSLPSIFVSCLSVSNFKHHIRSHFLTSFWQQLYCSVLNITSVCVCVCMGRHSYQLFSYPVNLYTLSIKQSTKQFQ